jgi:LL-diaminopimelate aminotransferase
VQFRPLLNDGEPTVTAGATRLKRLPAYPFALLTARVREMNARGLDVINLDIGSPDMPPPDRVVQALADSARRPKNHGYAGYNGTAEFRRAVARHYQHRFGVALDPDQNVLPLLGSKEGIVNLILSYIDAGDITLVPDIGYPAYSMGTYLAGGEVCFLPMREEDGFVPDLSVVPSEVLRRAKLLWINYPNNPTGATIDSHIYTRLVDFCRQHGILLASDNPYCDVTFDGYRAGSALQVAGALDCTIEFMSFSKSYNMAGWRLGAAVGSSQAIKTLLQVKSNVDSGHFHAIYDAGIAALEEIPQSWIDERNQVYQRRRDRILEALPLIGLTAHKTKGSLYIWGRTAHGDGAAYAEDVLLNARVSIAPGEIYGPGGRNYIRMSLGVTDERLEEALTRLKSWHESK